MFRIDHPTNTGSLPAPAVAGTPGFFAGSTVVTRDYMNALMEELCGFIEAMGITLDKTDRTQLEAAVAAKIAIALALPLALANGSTATTQATGDNSTKIATTALVKAKIDALINAAPGALDTLKELADAIGDDANYAATITALLALKAPLASPALTGTPTAPTVAGGDNSTKIATTAFVAAAVAALINSAPGALDTLKELADAIGDDANYAATITAALALKAPLASPALTGAPTAPTAAANDNSTKIATTAYVDAKIKKYINLNNFIAFGGTTESGFAHSLGAIPDVVSIDLVCGTAEGGFAIGDVVKCPTYNSYSSEDRGVQVRMTSTNVYVLFGSGGVEVINLSSGNRFAITAANWQFHVKAYRFP
jgi:hypothetical protein